MKNPIPFLRKMALIEAVSFLVLLGIAMPLKYVWGMPTAVKWTGWFHGVLFVVFCVALLQTSIVAKWPISRSVMVFVAALLPFGPFVVDRRMRGYEDEFGRGKRGDARPDGKTGLASSFGPATCDQIRDAQ